MYDRLTFSQTSMDADSVAPDLILTRSQVWNQRWMHRWELMGVRWRREAVDLGEDEGWRKDGEVRRLRKPP